MNTVSTAIRFFRPCASAAKYGLEEVGKSSAAEQVPDISGVAVFNPEATGLAGGLVCGDPLVPVESAGLAARLLPALVALA